MDHGTSCPLCRTVVHAARLPETVALAALLRAAFPAAYAAREAEEREERARAAGGGPAGEGYALPLFVMSVLFPGATTSLNIFEPRYRLLVRRVMEGSRRFGMAVSVRDPGGGTRLHGVASEVEITECVPQPDGRFHLDLKCVGRVRVERSWEQDGYRVARVRPLRDDPLEPGTAAHAEAAELGEQLKGRVAAGLETSLEELRRVGGGAAGLEQALAPLGRATQVPASDPEGLGLAVAAILPLSPAEEVRLLSLTDSVERLRQVSEHLDGLARGEGESRCAVM